MGIAGRLGLAAALFACMGFLDCDSSSLPPRQSCADDADCDEGGHCSDRGYCVYCEVSSDCDDGLYCDGRELCVLGRCMEGEPVECDDEHSLTHDACLESIRGCYHDCIDDDGDGHGVLGCGIDCDDDDRSRFPGNAEVCDRDDRDEDCDPQTFGDRDADGDGYVDAACCNDDASGSRTCGDDCDDTRASTHPTEAESCDGLDNDCDGAVDETVTVFAYVDQDHDGYGAGEPVSVCFVTERFATHGDDCDDDDPLLHPGVLRCVGSGSDIDICDGTARVESTCPGGGECVPQPTGYGVCLPGTSAACADGADNDMDGLIDFADPNCSGESDDSEGAERCADGLDNDGDGLADYPRDPGCRSSEDTSENDPATAPACANGLDDDGDGARDYAVGAGDPGCFAASDDDERDPNGPRCDNGLDDDMDGSIDYSPTKSGDLQCSAPGDDTEDYACDNGLDDDGDGLVDYPEDLGCLSATAESERGPNLICDNGLDDDMDGFLDFPADSGCSASNDATE